MKKIFLGYFMAVVGAAGVGIIAVAMGLSAADHAQSSSRPFLLVVSWPSTTAEVPAPPTVVTSTCVPQPLVGSVVGGLGYVAVPRLPGAVRLNYDNNGQSQYIVKAEGDQVVQFYQQELPRQCWQLSTQNPWESVWSKGGVQLRIGLRAAEESSKVVVNYRTEGRVLGESTFQMAQTSCPAGQLWCPNGMGGGSCMTGPCPAPPPTTPPPGDTTQCPAPPTCYGGSTVTYDSRGCPSGCTVPPSSGSTTACPSDQYACNGACIPMGSPCSGGGSYPTSGGTSCPSGQFWCYSKSTCETSYATCPSVSGGTPPPGGSVSCTGGQVKCMMNGGEWCQIPPCPSSSGSGSQPSACPSGQYWCPSSNTCVTSGSPCGGYGGTQPTPSGSPMSSTSGMQPDPACGQNGYRDPQGGCFQVGSGKTPILGNNGVILMCGDGMCEDNKGENSSNCPKDCGMPKQPPGSPYGGQYPGQAPGGFQGQPEQFPGGPGGPGGYPGGQWGGPGGPGMGPGGPGGMQMGPSEEEMKMMLQQMKQNIKPMEMGIRSMDKGFATAEKQLKKCGMSLPAGVKEAAAAMKEIVPKIKAAENLEDVFDLMSAAQEAGDVLQQLPQEIPMRIQFCMQFQQVSNPRTGVMKQLTQRFTTVNKKAQRTKNEGIIAVAKAAEEKVAAAQALADQLPGLLSSDFDKAQTTLDDLFSAVEDAHNAIQTVEAAMSAKSSMKGLNSEIRQLTTTLNRYEKKGEDVSAARALLAQLKEEVAIVLQDLKEKAPADQLMDDIETVFTTRNDVRDAVAEITGYREQEIQVNVDQKQYQMNVPEAFRSRQPVSSEPGQPTCNVNGVEMPGPCDQYNQGGGMPGGGFGPGPSGPSGGGFGPGPGSPSGGGFGAPSGGGGFGQPGGMGPGF